MPDFPAQPSPAAPVTITVEPPVSATLVVYVLFAIAAVVGLVGHGLLVGAPLFTVLGIVAAIIAYVKRSDARGTWTESHLTWLIRTFWWSFLWNCLGWLVAVTVVGFPLAIGIWIATTIWVIYRLIRGFLLFKDSKPIPGM